MNSDQICINCGHSYGKHRASFNYCPVGNPNDRVFSDTQYFKWNEEEVAPTYGELLKRNTALEERVKELERVLGIAKQYVKAWEVEGYDPLCGEKLKEHLILIYETIPNS